MSKTVVGFDIGNNYLKVAVMKGKTIKVHSVPIPENLVSDGVIKLPHLMSDFLKGVRKEYKIKSGPCGVIIPDNLNICRNMTIPAMNEKQLALNLPFEFSDYISDEPEKYVYDYAVQELIRDEDDNVVEMKLMAAAASKEVVQSYVSIFKNAGFNLQTVLPQEVALTNVMKTAIANEKAKPDKQYCIINLGHGATRVYIFKGDRLQVIRNISMGGADIDKAIAEHENVDQYMAATYKQTNYNGVLDKDYCREIFTKLTLEVMKVINFYYFNNRESLVDRVYFAGGASSIKALCHSIADTTNLVQKPVSRLLPEKMDDAEAANGLLAIGLLLQ